MACQCERIEKLQNEITGLTDMANDLNNSSRSADEAVAVISGILESLFDAVTINDKNSITQLFATIRIQQLSFAPNLKRKHDNALAQAKSNLANKEREDSIYHLSEGNITKPRPAQKRR